MELADLKGQKIMLAVSGGLDSCTITHWLVEQGVEVVAYTADLGQPDEKNIEDVRDRMLASGASEMILEDLIDPICRVGLQLVQSQARYEGGYWNTTGIARHVTVAGMLPHMQERGIHIMGHGARRITDLPRHRLHAVDVLIGEHDLGAFARENLTGRSAEARGPTSNERNLTVQS